MADRIFPNNTQINMGSKIEFQGINWDDVASSIKSNRFAEDKTQAVLELLSEAGISLSPEQESGISDIVEQFSNKNDEHFDNEETEESSDFEKTKEFNHDKPNFDLGDKESDEIITMKVSKNNNMRKISFTHPSQISAEAIDQALVKGDKKLANTILAARKENRLRIASKIQEQAKQAIKVAQSGGEMDLGGLVSGPATEPAMPTQPEGGSEKAYQDGFTAGQTAATGMPADNQGYSGTNLYKYMEGFFAAQSQKGEGTEGGAMPAPDAGGVPTPDANSMPVPTTAFVSPNKFTQAQRESFNKIALSLGFPQEYTKAMCNEESKKLNKEVELLNQKIKEVYSSSISENTKSSLFKSLVKEAKLSPDSKAEFIRFWNDLLGYQDKSFWPEVAEDYGDKK